MPLQINNYKFKKSKKPIVYYYIYYKGAIFFPYRFVHEKLFIGVQNNKVWLHLYLFSISRKMRLTTLLIFFDRYFIIGLLVVIITFSNFSTLSQDYQLGSWIDRLTLGWHLEIITLRGMKSIRKIKSYGQKSTIITIRPTVQPSTILIVCQVFTKIRNKPTITSSRIKSCYVFPDDAPQISV